MSVVGRNQQTVAGFDPVSLGGCALWLDAADAATLTLSGSNVTAWADKSGSNNNPTFGVNKPTYSATNRFVETSGLNQAFSIAGGIFNTVAGSIFMVFADKQENPTNGIFFGGLADYATSNFYAQSGQRIDGAPYALTGVNTPPAGFLSQINTKSTILYNQNYIYNSSNITAGINGTMYSMTSTFGNRVVTPSGGLAISGGVNWGGQTNLRLYEILFFNSILTTTQRQAVEGYLARKWTLQTNLPGTHPYKTFPPVYRDFSPLDLDGLSLWLDAADQNSLTLSGSNVTQWNDKSGNGYNATQASSANAPVYSTTDRCLQFRSASTQALTIPQGFGTALVGQRYSLIIVGRRRASGFQYFIAGSALVFNGNSNALFGYSGSTTATLDYYGSNVDATVPAYTDPDPIRVLGYESLASQRQIVVNGTVSGTGTAVLLAAYPTPEIGRRYGGTASQIYHDIDVFEMICYVPALSTTQRQQVEAYLARKWGLQSTVLAGTSHPYRYGPAVVLPTQISGCALWLDAADATTLTLSGSNVTAWADKSGNGRNATQSTTSNQPTYSTPTLTFNGAANLNLPNGTIPTGSGVFSLFIVGSVTNPSNVQYFLGAGTGTNNQAINIYTDVNTINLDVFGTRARGNFTSTTRTLFGYTYDSGSNLTTVVNGTSNSSTSGVTKNTGSGNNSIGASTGSSGGSAFYLTGTMNEILLYSNTPTTTQRQQIEGYLAWKWGLQSNLPTSNHPFLLYKSVTPTFTPLQLSGLSLWLDAADATTLTLSGSNVTQWNDKSGNGYNATQSTASNRPVYQSNALNGLGVVRFNGATAKQFITTPTLNFGTTQRSAFFVIQNTGPASGQASIPHWFWPLRGSGFNEMSMSAWIGVAVQGQQSLNSVTASKNTYLLFDVVFGATSAVSEAFLNGASQGTVTKTQGGSAWSNATGYSFGAIPSDPEPLYYFDGMVAEVLLFTNALSTAQRQQVEGYLAAKWGLRPSLPPSTNHPYRFGPWVGTPTQISGCALWLDAADATTLTLSGSNVTQWRDKSGNGNSTTSVTGTPQYTSNGVYFNGSAAMFGPISNTTNVMSSFLVGTINSSTGTDGRILSFSDTGQADFQSNTRCMPFFRFGTSSAISTYRNPSNASAVAVTYDRPFLAGTVFNGTNCLFFLNGAQGGTIASSTGTFNYSRYGLGQDAGGVDSNRLVGFIYEIISFNVSLTTAQRQQIEGYLAWKWGLQGNLTSGGTAHPYKSFTP